MFKKVLIANRGEIACRIARTLRAMGIGSVAIYSKADGDSAHASDADEAHCVGEGAVAESYLNQQRIFEIVEATGAEAIHPGYGLLSESPEFARACEERGIAFIGPTPEQMEVFALKHCARDLAKETKVPLLPGTGVLSGMEEAEAFAAEVGFPVILKSSGGGGGIGMEVCNTAEELAAGFEKVQRLARSNFASDAVFAEKFVGRSRHIEVQVFGDGVGDIMVLGERDCSVQRRNQKVIEETPAPGITEETRNSLAEAAIRLMEHVQYRSAGTVEFLFDSESGEFYFLEVNTRLQVEHGVTEAVTGVDIVEMMVRVAAGEDPVPGSHVRMGEGHAIEARIYAEDPNKSFQPSTGLITNVEFPSGVRVDTWISKGLEVSPHYDPLLAKLVVHAPTRAEAISALCDALAETRIDGIVTNVPYLSAIAASEVFSTGGVATRFLDTFAFVSRSVEVIAPGTQSSVQDFPGRIGYWEVGIPPSGPMDSLAFRIGNRVIGNPEDAAGLEMAMIGATLRFNFETVICLAGADMGATLDGEPVECWRPIAVSGGSVLKTGKVDGGGARCYLAIQGGIEVPRYLGSRSTFGLGAFGGHGGRALRTGDTLHVGSAKAEAPIGEIPDAVLPTYESEWEIGVLYGPHAAPDFFEADYLSEFLEFQWEVHFNSARTGVRLIGPKPGWARADGGEAGLHPSNIHDNPYAIGAIDFTGDMPVILGPDGPSLGGFVCPFTIASSELWKMGQLAPGDHIRFYLITATEANVRSGEYEDALVELRKPLTHGPTFQTRISDSDPVLHVEAGSESRPRVIYRASGDRNVLLEFGDPVLDIGLRLKVHQVYLALQEAALPGVLDITPGVRSLQVHFDQAADTETIVAQVRELESQLPPHEEIEVASRTVYLPLSWDDPSTREAIEKYHTTVRPDAPWYPSNIEFIRRINGLASIEQVKDTVFDARYVVLGLGDVYLGAPVATPLDPRHRLVTTKYNPARTWTPENAVGIGGAYLCIYGMEGPGGYQFVGRTVQMWNRYRTTEHFEGGKPWLLRFFDQIRFFPVSTEELAEIRHDFIRGNYSLKVEEGTFCLRDYAQFLETNAGSIESFRQQQRSAFDEERERWADAEPFGESEAVAGDSFAEAAPSGTVAVESPIAGSMWKVCVGAGDVVSEGQEIAVLESMKMEMSIATPHAGVVEKVNCVSGDPIAPGQALLFVKPA